MRLRLQAEPPLPVLKAWFAFDDNATIRNLKNAISTTVPALKAAKIKAETTTLELDGFELLDDLTFGGIVKDGDLVVIKQKEAGTSAKRKAESSACKPSKKAKYAHVLSSSESSTSESESSDDSDSSSDDSDSTSSSGSSAAPHAVPIRRKPAKASTNNVPPGQGSHQTQNRNQRRRLKKQYERSGVSMSTPPAPPKKTSAANSQPLGQEDEDLSLSMFSLGNKNKKKGYKQTLTRPTASKIVFEPKEDEPVPQSQPKPLPSRSNSTYERLVPPSERTDIPKNMFVSSVDVEAGLRPKKNKKKRKPPTQVWAEEEVVEEQMLLDYGDSAESILWQDIENTFDNLDAAPPALDESHVGGILAWKELTLNAISFSPEIMLQLARIVTVSPTSCTVQKIVRPGWEEEEVQSTEDLPFSSLTSSQMKYVKRSM